MDKLIKLKKRLIILLIITVPIFLFVSTYIMQKKTEDFIIETNVEKARKISEQLIITRDYISTIAPYVELTNKELHPFSFTPAYMGSIVAQKLSRDTGFYIKQTSQKYRNVKNLPDSKEREILKKLEKNNLKEYWEISKLNGKDSIRYGKSVYIKQECLACHGEVGKDVSKQMYDKIVSIYGDRGFGYKLGELRGMISVGIPLEMVEIQMSDYNQQSLIVILIVVVLILLFLYIENRLVYTPQILSITKSKEKLRELNQSLEDKVTQRTKELEDTLSKLENKNNKLEDSIFELTNTKDRLILSEKMATLANLIPSITKEINTPLGAIKLSSNVIEDDVKKLIENIEEVVYEFDENDKKLFFELLKDRENIENISTKDIRVYKKRLIEILEKEIDNPKDIASLFVKIGIFDINKYIDNLKNDKIEKILIIVYSLVNITKNSSNIDVSTDIISEVISALKIFSKLENSTVMNKVIIKDSIDTVLTLYRNRLKDNIEIIKEYKQVGSIYCYLDQMYQVWVNLIQNSIDAIKDNGVITVSISEDDIYQIVSIKDNGIGIPQENKERVFEPFFTTKDISDSSSGLGLEICKKIIENHNGKIEFNSDSDYTEFKVYLPKNII
jgi:signal transduction histidine kinase